MINTSECEECIYGTLDETDKAKITIECDMKNKKYIYGQYVPCDSKRVQKKDRVKQDENKKPKQRKSYQL